MLIPLFINLNLLDTYGDEEDEIVNVILLVGGVETERYKIYLLHKYGFSEPAVDYGTIGSGAAYAEYLLGKYYRQNIDVNIGKRLAVYVVKEVEKMDPNVGGDVKIVVIDKEGYHEVERDEIDRIQEVVSKYDKLAHKLMGDLLNGNVKVEDVKVMMKTKIND